MTTTKQSWLKRSLAVLLVVMMVMSMGVANAFAATLTPETPIEKIDVPAEDGVYYADIDLINAANVQQVSMGNAALRGSSNFEANHPEDTDYRAIVVVKDNTATAILEFMPLGFIGMQGFMMELESVDAKYLTAFGGVFDTYGQDGAASFTTTQALTYHMTQKGEPVYDMFNDPESESVYNGNVTRPAGYGHENERPVDIENVPYPHLIAVDATPVWVKFENTQAPTSAAEYNRNNAAYVHVFVPVMFSIMPTSGDQYARLHVDWTSLDKIEQPEQNLEYRLYTASQIEQTAYTPESYQAFQKDMEAVTSELNNIWPSTDLEMGTNGQPKLTQKEWNAEERAAFVKRIDEAQSKLELIGDKTNLNALIAEAEAKKETAYTPSSWSAFAAILQDAKAVQSDEDAGQNAVNSAAEALTNAMEALVLRADTSELAALVQQAEQIEKGDYTEASFQALQQAITAAKEAIADADVSSETLAVCKQQLQTALDSLTTDSEEPELDRYTLEDGVYSVYGEMIKTNRQEKSMSNDAINHTIKLTVEDGKYYLTMDFHGLAYLNKFGYLAELSYYDNGYTYGQYGAVDGTPVPATVLSTQKNADGSDVYDEFNQAGGSYEGKLYPDQIKFPLVADALADKDGYVPLHVFVPVMEDISAGTGDQDVLLKLDWSTLKKTTEDDPAFEPEEPVEQSPAVDYTDAATGVKVNADKGVFDEGVQIVVSEITKGADYDNAVSSLSDVGKKFKLYDVKFLDADGNEVTPNGTVSISFPIAAGYDSANLAVYRMDDGGKVLVRGTVENGYYTVITKTAGTYVLVEKGSTITDAENTANIPQTGDDSNVAVFALLALAAAGMMGVTLVTRKRKSNEA